MESPLPGKPVPLSTETEQQIASLHRMEDYDAVRAMLLEVGTKTGQSVVERVRFDILHLAAGDPACVRSLVDVAMQDPRDVMSLEYFHEDGISKPRDWAMVHEVNRRLQASIDAGEVKPYYLSRRPRD